MTASLAPTSTSATQAGLGTSAVPSVLAVVVTHRGRPWLKECLIALAAQTYPELDVLVVDDASRDFRQQPQLKRIAKRHLRRLRWGFLRTPRPLGFGGAINWALSRVRTDAELLLFVHDDAALTPDAVERMVARVMADENTAIVGPKVVAWDDPDRLEEVGMAADRFGYPYKGLEEGEIDLGQHDVAAEVFYVTSTCLLVKHEVFRALRGWDVRMRAFGEDLDLCWRARVAGYAIRVEPLAKARHAMALATGRRESPFTPTRYFIRRNRLRAVTKNVSGVRLLALVPQFVLLALMEMIAFTILRQPREILNLARALGWNLVVLPQTLSERARVQGTRKVLDRKLRRFTVRDVTRLRAYLGQQAERLEQAWGRRAQYVAARVADARALQARLGGWTVVILVVAVVAFILGFRHLLWSPPAAIGELLPYPDRPTALWRAFLSPWQGVGLGQPGPASPALVFLGLFPLVTLGAAGAAQKLLILTLGVAAVVGAYKLLADLVDPPSRVVAGLIYGLGAVGFSGIRHGALGALVFGAVAPFVLRSMVRVAGIARPPGWIPGRAIARIAAGSALSAAFVPGSLLLYAVAAAVLTAVRSMFTGRGGVGRGLIPSAIGLALGWALLLPWSATWWTEGGPWERLMGDGWDTYAASFAGHGFASVLSGQTPDAPALFGLALPLLGVIAVLTGEGQRRRMALALWGVVLAMGGLVFAFASGWLRPVVASPSEAGVLAAVAFAGLAGLAVGAFRMDLPRRGLGLVHAVTLGGIAAASFLVVTGLGPAFWRGDWAPGRGSGAEDAAVVAQIGSLLASEADQVGQFRTLWVGDRWAPVPSAARPFGSHLLTGSRGQMLTDLFERTPGEGASDLDRVIASIEEGSTDRGGSLLGAFNIHYVVLDDAPGARPWLQQRDLGVIRSEVEGRYLILENQVQIARAGIYNEVPVYVRAIENDNPAITSAGFEIGRVDLKQSAASRYSAARVTGPGVVFLAEARDERWRANLGDLNLVPMDAGWGNAFDLPAEARGPLTVSYPRSLGALVWLLVMALAWIVVLGAALSRARRPPRAGIKP